MDKVWAVFYIAAYEGSSLISIHRTQEGGRKAAIAESLRFDGSLATRESWMHPEGEYWDVGYSNYVGLVPQELKD